MAFWIESHADLDSHPKLLLFKSRMRWSKNETVGFLHRFWWMVLKYAPDGVITALPPEVMCEVLDMDLVQVANAIGQMKAKDVRFIEVRGDDLVVRNWWQYAKGYLRGRYKDDDPVELERIKSLYGNKPYAGVTPELRGLPTIPTKPTNQPNTAAPGDDEAIYAEYPRKTAKAAALKAISKARQRLVGKVDDPQAFLLSKVTAYRLARDGADPQFTPHPATWFNQDRFDDDPAEWSRWKTQQAADPLVEAKRIARGGVALLNSQRGNS